MDIPNGTEEEERWNWIEREFEASSSRVKELEEALEEIRDLARTGSAPDAFGFTTLAEWNGYKLVRVAGMANEALNK